VNVTDGLEEVEPLGLGQARLDPGQVKDGLVGPEQSLDLPEPGGLLEESEVPGSRMVETEG
jgi:hypothetical protein